MKTNTQSLKLILTILFFVSILFINVIVSVDTSSYIPSPDDPSANCVLNFTSFPYEPTGECIGVHEKINDWDSFPTTLCCQSALTTLSQALALRAKNTADGNIFLSEDQWKNCSGPFLRQESASVNSCGFENLYYGSNVCSKLNLASLKFEQKYQKALDMCSSFNPSFEGACKNCTRSIKEARDHLLDQNGLKRNSMESATCGVAVVISVAAGKLDDRLLVEDFFRCLPALNVFDPGYIKLKYSHLPDDRLFKNSTCDCSDKSQNSLVKTVLAIILAIIGFMLVIMLVKYVNKKKPALKPSQFKEISKWSGLYRFSKAEIENAIGFFGTEGKSLGRGSAGQVYKGILPSGQVVAIKHIFKSNMSDSFTREVEGLSRVRHPNLVCLFGCCVEDGEQYLVYEYCAAGNLAQHLLRDDTVLTWPRRVKILRDCALGLRYLHRYIDGCIVHRDIKLTNILLTENLEPKLSDFGLAKMLGMEESKVFTDVRGTLGYMDPEYMSNAKLTCASDIYSFGIVALQLLSGQKVIELDLDARDQLTRKAKDVHMGKRPLTDIEDPRLNGNVNSVDFESILQVAVLCAAKSSKGRPTIDVVFEEMDKAWKNTLDDMRAKREMDPMATPMSRSLEVVPL